MADTDFSWLTPKRRRLFAYVFVVCALVVLSITALAATYDVDVKNQARFQTDSNLTVYHTNDITITSGNPFTGSNGVRIETSNGAANYSASSDAEARIDNLNGTWSNVSQLQVSNTNLTVNPDGMDEGKIKGGVDRFKLSNVTVDDGDLDLMYGGSGDTATITVISNGSDGTAYGLVDADTGAAQDVAIADSNGKLVFDQALVEDNQHKIKVQDIGTLTIRNAEQPHSLITGANITAKFFTQDGAQIINRTDDNNDGKIDLAGFPIDETFIVQIDHPDYEQRTTIIEDTAQQDNAFLLSNNADPTGLEIEFLLQDQTGKFDASTTQIIVERPINATEYDSDFPAEEFKYRNVAGDDIGADQRFVTILQKNTRYRVTVKNNEGDVRQLGAFTPTSSGEVPLDIGTIDAEQKLREDVKFSANRTDINGNPHVVVEYNDTRDKTDTLWIEIYEWRNESNKLKQNTSFTGPLGTASVTEKIPSSENDTEWVVELTAERSNAENIKVIRPLSPRENLLPGLPAWLVTLISVGTIWIIGGAFSQLNGDVGALVIAGLGAMFYFVGFTPPALGAGVVILMMITAALIFVHERRAGGL